MLFFQEGVGAAQMAAVPRNLRGMAKMCAVITDAAAVNPISFPPCKRQRARSVVRRIYWIWQRYLRGLSSGGYPQFAGSYKTKRV